MRLAGLTLVQLTAQRCSDSGTNSALVVLVLSLGEALHGKPVTAGGRSPAPAGGGVLLTLESQKTTILQALGSCVTVMTNFSGSQRGEGTQVVLEAAVTTLLTAIEKEKEVTIKHQEASLAARWLLCHSSLPAATLTHLVKALSSKPTAGPALLLLSSLFAPPASGNVSEYARAVADSPPLVAALLKCVTDAQSKPHVASPEGVLALRVLLEVHALAALSASAHSTLTAALATALSLHAAQAESSFLLTLALHSQLAGRSSSISSINHSPLGHGVLEALLAIVGIAHRDYATTVPLFVPLKALSVAGDSGLESKEEEEGDSCLGYGYGSAARKLVIFSVVSLQDHHLRQRVCGYWLPSLLRSCGSYSMSQPGTHVNVQLAGSLSLLGELNTQLRAAAEHRERVRSDE